MCFAFSLSVITQIQYRTGNHCGMPIFNNGRPLAEIMMIDSIHRSFSDFGLRAYLCDQQSSSTVGFAGQLAAHGCVFDCWEKYTIGTAEAILDNKCWNKYTNNFRNCEKFKKKIEMSIFVVININLLTTLNSILKRQSI